MGAGRPGTWRSLNPRPTTLWRLDRPSNLWIIVLGVTKNASSKDQRNQHMKHRFLTLTIVLPMILVLSDCIHTEPPHQGIIKDAETGKPLKGVVVLLNLTSGMPLGPDGVTQWKGSYQTVTDNNGKYSFSIKFKGQLPLEFSTGHELSFFKAGYLPSRILEPSLSNTIFLHPIKYYLDYSHCRESIKRGHLNPRFMAQVPEGFSEYKKELLKMETLPFERIGDKGDFASIPNGKIVKISCRATFDYDKNPSKPYTFGISGTVCKFFDETSDRTMTLDAQGNIKEAEDNLLVKYNLVSIATNESEAVYAGSDSIYIPKPPYSNMATLEIPQKGHITALAGDSHEYLTLEDDGLYLCYSSIRNRMGRRCISINDAIPSSGENARFVLLSQGRDAYFVVSKNAELYQIHKVTHENDSAGNARLALTEQLLPSFPVEDEIIDLASDDRVFFVAFKQTGIRKYSLDMNGKGPLKEDKIFYDNSHDLFVNKSVTAVELGRSVSEHVLYVTVGTSTVYRLSLDGIPDSKIRIVEDRA
jgi:hypothetical protein